MAIERRLTRAELNTGKSAYDRLLPAHQIFVEEFIRTRSRLQAAIKAGYQGNSNKYALSRGSKLLHRPDIAAAIHERQVELAERAGVHQVRVLKELCRIGYVDPVSLYDETGDLKSPRDLKAGVRRAIKEIKRTRKSYGRGEDRTDEDTVEYKLHDKLAALRLLGAYLGMWQESDNGSIPLPPGADAPGKSELDDARRLAYVLQLGLRAAQERADAVIVDTAPSHQQQAAVRSFP
jgi:phage terminase small subunit